MNFGKSSRTRKIIVGMIIFVLLLTIAVTFLAYNYFKNQKIQTLNERVTSFAVALDATSIQQLHGTELDLKNQAYIDLKQKLIDLQTYNSDTTFVYLMGKSQGDTVFFYADSEPADSEDYSPPGQIYDEASDVIYEVFDTQSTRTEVSSDRWGTWLSVMAPVVDKSTGTTAALVGFDMSYSDFLTEVILFTSLPAAIGLIILILLIAVFFYAKKDESMMQLRSEYFAIAAHDFRTPLTGIKWAASSLKKSKPINSDGKAVVMVDHIHDNSESMLSSVNELLDGSSLEHAGAKLVINDVDISILLANAYGPQQDNAMAKKLKVTFSPGKNLVIKGDSDKLRRIFANLISNAIKYSKENGSIKIAAKKVDKTVVVTVKDSGIGIPANEQSKVFSGYFRASNAKAYTTQGTGLGLYYVKNVVEMHGGKITLYSVPDKGTEFTLTFPLN